VKKINKNWYWLLKENTCFGFAESTTADKGFITIIQDWTILEEQAGRNNRIISKPTTSVIGMANVVALFRCFYLHLKI
jgi:hypothetical protein